MRKVHPTVPIEWKCQTKEVPLTARAVCVLLLVAFLAVACSPPDLRPREFEGMSEDEVGCIFLYGDVPKFVGPLGGPSDFWEFGTDENSVFRISRIALGVSFAVESPGSLAHGSRPLSELHEDGGTVIFSGGSGSAANPEYVATCWHGDG